MDIKNIKSILQDALEDEFPASEINFLPAVQSHLVAGKKQATQQREKMNKTPIKRLAFASLTIVALMVISLATPQGRAWAQEAFQFFKRVNFTIIPLSDDELRWIHAPDKSYGLPLVPVYIPTLPPDMASLPECKTAEEALSYSCQIAYAESQLGFDLMELPKKPQGLEFRSVRFDAIEGAATVGYGTSYDPYGMSLSLTQRLGQGPEQYGPWAWVPIDKVEKIKVGNFDGEYVSGSFSLPVGGNELEWWDYAAMDQRIAWSDGTFWYLLEMSLGTHEAGYLERDQFIELAASLVKKPIIQEEKPNQRSLVSISQAEEVSGLDLKAPTLLPLGLDFSYAGYYPFNHEVQIRYDGDGYMVIHEWAGKSLDFESLSTIYKNYEIVKVKGEPAFYGSVEGSSPYILLCWKDGGLNYQMYFYSNFDGIHGVIDKEKMITIADSMDDINVFRGKSSKPYEYVSIYEKTLNIDIKEFPTTPQGWSFNQVWADAYGSCVTLLYKSDSLQDSLVISGCKTNPLNEYTDIPKNSLESVKVGNNKGNYIVGWFGIDEDGSRIWQSDQPQRSLVWKENGLWLEIIVNGKSALSLGKEDLISLAKSLE